MTKRSQHLRAGEHGGADQHDFERAATLAAHEMNGPLTTAAAAIELLASRIDPEDEAALELISVVGRHLRLARLQSSRFARLATTPDPPDRRRTDLVELATEVVDDLSFTELANHPASVEADGAIEAMVDADQIRQILFNLLTNAARYSPRGRAIVVAISDDGEQVRLRVRDQGHGVAPEAAKRIFDPYERALDDSPGIGLGLSVARAIARSHGGDLGLEPATEEGSVFILTLPHT